MKLEAKNIHKYQSPDGYAWDASFYMDGKKIGTAYNSGNGGPTNLRDIDSDALKVLEDYAANTPPHNEFNFEQVESLLESVMWDTLDMRETKRLLKAKVVKHDGGLAFTEWKIPKGHTVETVKAFALKKYPDAKFLNDMPIDKANKLLHPTV